MPGYGGSGSAMLLRSNKQAFLFQHELISAGTASMAFQLERISGSFYPWGASFHVQFTNASGQPADPGAFEIDIQTSDVDSDQQYCVINQWTAGTLNASFVGRIELPNFFARFVRAFVKTLTNPVYVTLIVTR